MPERSEIIDTLRTTRESIVARYREFPLEDLSRECTQSEAPDGAPWSAKDHLAHLAMIERAFQDISERTIAGEENPIRFPGTSREEIMAYVHGLNQANVDEHRGDDLNTLLADLDAARGDTLALIDRLSDEQLAIKIPGAPWGDGSIGGVLQVLGGHERMHLTWAEEGLSRVLD